MSKITESARGQECQVRIIGVCNGNPATVIWAHANGLLAGKGIGMKSKDLLGAYACQACHDHYDRRISGSGIDHDKIKLDFYEGHMRSLAILIEKGIVKF